MRLLNVSKHQLPTLTTPWKRDIPRYAILSHTWLRDEDEVTFTDIQNRAGTSKLGYEKLRFCNDQARKDKLDYFWADTCCINKDSDSELSEAINSMFKWYQNAARCYVYLPDVHFDGADAGLNRSAWISAFHKSLWFTRGWTLQELLAPKHVDFYSKERVFLGDKRTLEQDINNITGIPVDALQGRSPLEYSVEERLAWADQRQTTKEEDKAYCLFGLFNVFLPLLYGEGANAFTRLKEEVERTSARGRVIPFPSNLPIQNPQKDSVDRKEIVAKAEQYLNITDSAPKTKCLLLYGLPGSGKTHLAERLALQWGIEKKPAYWLDASSPEALSKSCVNFVVSAGLLPLQAALIQSERDVRMKMHAYLEESKQPWLLIFDNYDVFQLSTQLALNSVIPENNNGRVIITSRNAGLSTSLGIVGEAISVQAMNPTEAHKLFCIASKIDTKQLDNDSQRAITRITSELLCNLPLAVAQAGAFVGNMVEYDIPLSDTLQQYMQEYLTNRDTVLEEVDDEFVQTYGQSIITLFSMAFSAIQKKSDTASRLLLLFSFYHHHNISLGWFKRASETYFTFHRTGIDLNSNTYLWFQRLVKPHASGRWSSTALRKTLQLLSDYNLLDLTKDKEVLSIHPLVHSWSTIFMQQQGGQSVDEYSHLAAAVLSEVYDKQTDIDLQQIYKARSEIGPHAEAWVNATQPNRHNLTSDTEDPISSYVYNRLGDYLNLHHLSPTHEVRGTVPELRLLAFKSELSRGIVSSHHMVWSLRQLTLWLASRAEIAETDVTNQSFSLIRAIIDKAVPTESCETFYSIAAQAEVLHEEMIVASGDHGKSVPIAKLGQQYIKAHQKQLKQVDEIRILGSFLHIIACFDTIAESRLRSFWELLDVYKRSEAVLGKTHFATIRLLAQVSNAKSFNRSDAAVSAIDMIPKANWQRDVVYSLARVSLLNHEIAVLKEQQTTSPAMSQLMSEKHRISRERQGEWHFETLEAESMALNQMVNAHGLTINCPGVFGTDRWLTRNESLILPIEVAIALLVTGQHDRAQSLWPGYLNYLTLVKQSDQIVTGCEVSYLRAADLCMKRAMPSEGVYFRNIAASLSGRDGGKSVSTSLLLQFTEHIHTLWQLLGKLQWTLTTGDEAEKSGISTAILIQLRVTPSVLRESLLYLLIQYLLYVTYQGKTEYLPVLTMEMLENLSPMVVETFGKSHILTYRWMILEAIASRQYVMVDRAHEIEGFLQFEMIRSFNEADEDPWYSDADRKRTRDGKALTWEWLNSRMTGKSVSKFANVCLERLSIEYGKRQWYTAQVNICEQRLLAHVSGIGIQCKDVHNLILVTIFAISNSQEWTRLWTLLESFSQPVKDSSVADQEMFTSRLITEVILKLLQTDHDRGVILLIDWYWMWLAGVRQPVSASSSMGQLRTRWSFASCQRLSYHRLKYYTNAAHLSEEMYAIQGYIEARFDELPDDIQSALQQQWETEENLWREMQSAQ